MGDQDYRAVPPPTGAGGAPPDFQAVLAAARERAEQAKRSGTSSGDGSEKRRPYDEEDADRDTKRPAIEDYIAKARDLARTGGSGSASPDPSALLSMTGTIREELRVSHNAVGGIIGRSGENLRRVEQETRTQIKVSSNRDEPTRQIVIMGGRQDDIEAAKRAIMELGAESERRAGVGTTGPGGTTNRVATSMGTDKFNIPGHKAGVIIGPGGSQIKELKDRTKAHITVSDDPDDPDKRLVIIIGEQEVRDAARDAINELLAASDRVDPSHALPAPPVNANGSPAPADAPHTTRGSPQPYAHQASPTPPVAPGGGFSGYGSISSIPQGSASQSLAAAPQQQSRVEFPVPHSTVGLVIGRGGETIRRLQAETGAIIKFPPADPDSHGMRTCIITGDVDCVNNAVRVIEGIMTGGRSSLGPPPDAYHIRLPADRIGLVIGKGGENIRALERQSGAKMTVDNLNGATARERTVFVSASSPQIIAYAELLVYQHIGEAPPPNSMAAMYGLTGSGAAAAAAPASYDYSAYYAAYYPGYYGYGAAATGATPAATGDAAAAGATGATAAAATATADATAATAAGEMSADGQYWLSPMYPGYRFSYATQQWEAIPAGATAGTSASAGTEAASSASTTAAEEATQQA